MDTVDCNIERVHYFVARANRHHKLKAKDLGLKQVRTLA